MSSKLDSDFTVKIFCFKLDITKQLEKYYCQYLNDSELSQLKNLSHAVNKNQWIATRAVLRLLLEPVIAIAAKEISFFKNTYGKPYIATDSSRHIEFNLSHSHQLGVIALSRKLPVGIDIQLARQSTDIIAFSKRFFSTEEANYLSQLSPKKQRLSFNHLWTRKEALFKAVGKGITMENLKTNLISDNSSEYLTQITINNKQYQLKQLPDSNNYCCAVCLQENKIKTEWQDWIHPQL